MSKHTRYVHAFTPRRKYMLKWSEDLKCYYLYDGLTYNRYPTNLYLGERTLYVTPGLSGPYVLWRGNLSDDWPCIDFDLDFKEALEWLHAAEEPERTLELWTK